MRIVSRIALTAFAVGLCYVWPGPSTGSPTQWAGSIAPSELGGGFGFGVWPGAEDGYDGQPLSTSWNWNGIHILLHRESGSGWSGPSGFYSSDLESPIPDGGSHAWGEAYLWSCNYTPPLGDRVGTFYVNDIPAPVGYWGQLVLDYVPAHLNWTGDTEWLFPLWTTGGYNVPALPCPITDDPFNPANVTRMHLTVYTYNPVPEPCSLAVLALGLAGAGWRLRRR